MSRRRVAILVFCVLCIGSAMPARSVAQVRRVEGFEGYKFGMTLDEALAVRPSAKQTQCDYNGVAVCIEYPTTVSAFSGRVVVQFKKTKTLLLSKILVTIRSFDEQRDPPCHDVGKEISKLLVTKYGNNPYVKDHTATWAFAEGGAVSFLALCMSKEKGMNVISYEPSSAL